MRLIDIDKLVLNYSGLAHISPYDFVAIAKYFMNQIETAPTIVLENLARHGGGSHTTHLLTEGWRKEKLNGLDGGFSGAVSAAKVLL